MLHSIFSYFVAKGDQSDTKRLGYLSWFVLQYPQEEFRREEAIFRDFLQYCTRLSVPLKPAYFDVYLSTELKKYLVESKTKIDGTEQLSYDDPRSLETALSITRETMAASFREIASNAVDIADFPVYADKFRVERLNQRTSEILGQGYDRMSKGYDDSAEWIREQLTNLNDIYSAEALENLEDTASDNTPMEPVITTGISAIDQDITAVMRTQLIDISAPPGAGKTRMAIGVFSHRALMAGRNVLYYTLEQSKAEIEAMLVARHVYHMFNHFVTDKQILSGTVDERLKAEVETARIDILESGRWGKFVVKEADLYLEDFIEKIKTQDRVNGPFDVIIIDHMSLMQSMPSRAYARRLDDYQIVAKSYRRFKQYVRKTRKVGVSVNQFNREGIEASRQDKEINATMGAGGIEAYRSTDANITITYTETMAAQNLRRISLPKSRSSEGFGSIMVRVYLGSCYFIQEAKKQV